MILSTINQNTKEGKLLMAALVILTTNNYTDITPEQVLDLLEEISNDMIQSVRKSLEGETSGNEFYKEWPESSQVLSTAYDQKEKELIVVFKNNNKPYAYTHFPIEKWSELLKCESIGSYINKEVKGKFNYRPLQAEEVAPAKLTFNTPEL